MNKTTSRSPDFFRPRVGRIVRKELREILRDRRTILTMVVMPLLLYPLLTVACRQLFFIGGLQADAPVLRIGYKDRRSAQLVNEWLANGEGVLNQKPNSRAANKATSRRTRKHWRCRGAPTPSSHGSSR
ncbi:MAG: hypothetical protein R3C10_11470 [Pirellulales bacterium]